MMANPRFMPAVVVVFSLLVVMAGLVGPAAAGESKPFWVSVPGETAVREIRLSAGQERVIRLKTTLVEGQLLKAYSLKIGFDENALKVGEIVGAPGAPIPVMSVNKNGNGLVRVNGFDVKGISGPVQPSILDLSSKGLGAGKTALRLSFDNFGKSKDDQFIPAPIFLDIIVD